MSNPIQTLHYQVGVVGTASFDTLHVAGNTIHTIGGAGLYTTLAAHRAGATAHLMAPFPSPMPPLFTPVIERIHWSGPIVAPERLPRLEIEHHGQGQATLRHASWGAETELTPSVLSIDTQQITIIHIAALSSARRQLEFVQAIRAMNIEVSPRISVGTYARLVANEKEAVQQLFKLADYFFMNENEAQGLFGTIEQARTRPGALLCVTLGNQGVLVIEGDHVTRLPARTVIERDPTGAGDTFCGATLAGVAMDMTPIVAATRAMKFAAATVADFGPASLLT